jgi:hypothetical protein
MAAFILGYSGDHAEVADRPDTPTNLPVLGTFKAQWQD